MLGEQATAERLRHRLLKLIEREPIGNSFEYSRTRVAVPPVHCDPEYPVNPLAHRDGAPWRYDLNSWERGRLLLPEWDADHPARIISFKRERWEHELLTLTVRDQDG